MTGDGFTILFSGKENLHANSVVLIISRSTKKSLVEWGPVSDRIISAWFYSKYCKLTILKYYSQVQNKQGGRLFFRDFWRPPAAYFDPPVY